MATDARISIGLPTHPKTKKLVRQLGAQAGWSLVVLILWTASTRSDGDLSGMSDEDIELASDWDGEPGAFIAALRKIRFVDGDEGQCHIHDWTEHQPWAAGSDARSLKAKWNAVKRHHGERAADREVPEYAEIRNAGGMLAAQGQHATSTTVAPKNDATSMHAASEQHAHSMLDACSSPSPLRLLSESSPSPSPSPTRASAKPKPPSPTGHVWEAYATAYFNRYGVEPVRNAKVNAQIAQLVARIGESEAPSVASFYVGHQASYYVGRMHPVDCLLSDAEKLRTEWATGRRMTGTKAIQTDKTATNAGAFQALIEAAEAKERSNGQH